MPDDKLKEFIKDTAKGVEYFGKIRKGRSPLMERMEDAVEGPVTPPPQPIPEPPLTVIPEPKSKMPYGSGEFIKSGEEARAWTGSKPWTEMKRRSIKGSKPFTDKEMKKGYRKL